MKVTNQKLRAQYKPPLCPKKRLCEVKSFKFLLFVTHHSSEVQIFPMIFTFGPRSELPSEKAAQKEKYLQQSGSLQRERCWRTRTHQPSCRHTCEINTCQICFGFFSCFFVFFLPVERRVNFRYLCHAFSKPQTLSGNFSSLQWPYFSLLISVLADRNVQQIHIYQV